MDLCQIAPLSPACVVGRAAGVAGDAVLATVGDVFTRAAAAVLDAVFAAIASATTVDVAAPYVTRNAAALTAVAGVVVVGLFVVQVAAAAVRREPAGLTRAVTGAAVAVLGAGAAGTITAALLAVDAVCEGIAALAGTSITAAARKLLDVTVLAQLANVPGGPALMLLFGLLFILGATLTLGTLLVRQALIVIAVVVAPLAFAGATARLTSGWVHRWVQLTLALILSKLAIVIVFVVAVGLLGETSGLGELLSGLILLLVACLSPWACFKVLDFADTHLATDAHRSTSGAAVSVANQGRYTATSLIRTAATVVGGPTAGAAAGATGRTGSPGSARSSRSASDGAGSPTLHRPIPPPTPPPGGSQSPSSSAPQTGGGNPAASPAPAGPAGPPATAGQSASLRPPDPPPSSSSSSSSSGGTR